MTGPVLDRHRPTLGEIAAGWSPRRRIAALVLVALLVVALAARIAFGGGESGEPYVYRGKPLSFNFLHDAALKPVAPNSSELVRLERRRDSLFLQSFAVSPLTLAPYDGDVGGQLPVVADEHLRRLAAELGQSFQVAGEGKARVNEVAAYTMTYRWKAGGRTFYGRSVLVPSDEAVRGPRPGVLLELVATPASGVGRAADVGLRGAVKKPYRSFRFGTERP